MATFNVSDEIHLLVINKWTELKNKGKKMKISDVAECAIKNGIDKVGEDL